MIQAVPYEYEGRHAQRPANNCTVSYSLYTRTEFEITFCILILKSGL